MHHPRRAALRLALAFGLMGSALHAQTAPGPDLRVETPWLRATPNGASVAAGYLRVTNAGGAPDRLVGARVPFAGRVEVHEMAMQDGVMKMRALPNGLDVAPGATVELKPGGYHLMFLDLKNGLKEGQSVPATLLFQNGGEVPVTFSVGGLGGSAPGKAH